MNINELVKPEYYNDLMTNQAVFWLGNGVTHAPCTCLLAKYGKVDRIMLIFWRALRKLTNYRAAFGGSPPWLRSRFPTEGLSFSIYGNFLPDSRTASIQGLTGPPLFLSVTDRGLEDFPMSVAGVLAPTNTLKRSGLLHQGVKWWLIHIAVILLMKYPDGKNEKYLPKINTISWISRLSYEAPSCPLGSKAIHLGALCVVIDYGLPSSNTMDIKRAVGLIWLMLHENYIIIYCYIDFITGALSISKD